MKLKNTNLDKQEILREESAGLSRKLMSFCKKTEARQYYFEKIGIYQSELTSLLDTESRVRTVTSKIKILLKLGFRFWVDGNGYLKVSNNEQNMRDFDWKKASVLVDSEEDINNLKMKYWKLIIKERDKLKVSFLKEGKKLNQSYYVELLGISQPRTSRLFDSRFIDKFSLTELMAIYKIMLNNSLSEKRQRANLNRVV